MVELQIVVLAVAGSSPVGHPLPVLLGRDRRRSGTASAKRELPMNNPADPFGQTDLHVMPPTFWKRILQDEELRECNNLEKLLAGCEIIAALDGRDLLAA